ncbi:MAG: DNA polymerase IV [Propionibacteriaceae bacterium]|jgi:DNA polymerase-4|nr:DNA polymerase IV [Propionibacteriaceae bacterium]
MRATASILHLDMDAFFAAVEQRDKPSLRGKPVVVGGIGPRGVVSTASYEARVFGVRSAMPTAQARKLCPNAAYLSGRFGAYHEASKIVMGLLRQLSPLVEPLSVDEAFVDLQAAAEPVGDLLELGRKLRADVFAETGGLTASVGIGTSKFIAKVGSELAKPDGLRVVEPGTEADTIAGLPARAIPGVGPATMERLARLGVKTVLDVRNLSDAELVRALGKAGGEQLYRLSRAEDDRPVVPERAAKSISVEDTFATDVTDAAALSARLDGYAEIVAKRLVKAQLFARTVTVKVRWPDFSFTSRSRTLEGATDQFERIRGVGRSLLAGFDVAGGVRLLGLGVSGFADVAQEPLFDLGEDDPAAPAVVEERQADFERRPFAWYPGADVVHDEYGPGWVWGAGLGRVTVRFETAETPPGPVRTFAQDDPALHPA